MNDTIIDQPPDIPGVAFGPSLTIAFKIHCSPLGKKVSDTCGQALAFSNMLRDHLTDALAGYLDLDLPYPIMLAPTLGGYLGCISVNKTSGAVIIVHDLLQKYNLVEIADIAWRDNGKSAWNHFSGPNATDFNTAAEHQTQCLELIRAALRLERILWETDPAMRNDQARAGNEPPASPGIQPDAPKP